MHRQLRLYWLAIHKWGDRLPSLLNTSIISFRCCFNYLNRKEYIIGELLIYVKLLILFNLNAKPIFLKIYYSCCYYIKWVLGNLLIGRPGFDSARILSTAMRWCGKKIWKKPSTLEVRSLVLSSHRLAFGKNYK